MGLFEQKFEFITLTEKTAEQTKNLIMNGYKLIEYPEKPVLIYKNGNNIVKVKVKLGKLKCSTQKVIEAKESFEAYNMGQDDHLHDEVGKLVAITGAALYGREEQLILLRRTFSPRETENNASIW